jgi:hypothetical protein
MPVDLLSARQVCCAWRAKTRSDSYEPHVSHRFREPRKKSDKRVDRSLTLYRSADGTLVIAVLGLLQETP